MAAEAHGYCLPYFTRLGGDTEWLICNPGAAPVAGTLTVYGPACAPIGDPVAVRVGPYCVQSVRLAGLVPDNAGHGILDVSAPVLVGLGYLRAGDDTLIGQAMLGRTSLVGPDRPGDTASYGFAYRTQPFT